MPRPSDVSSKKIDDRTRPRAAPLSPFQRIWLIDQHENGGPMRPTVAALRLDGPLHVGLAGRGLNEIWRRHESLRARIRSQRSRTYLWIARSARPDLSIVNLEDLSAS